MYDRARPDDLRAAAELVEGRYPAVAILLRAEADAAEPGADRREARKRILRALWRRNFFGESRSATAYAISAAWHAWQPGGPELPGTLDKAFARLHRLGFRPLGWRTIADVLDQSLDQ